MRCGCDFDSWVLVCVEHGDVKPKSRLGGELNETGEWKGTKLPKGTVMTAGTSFEIASANDG